MWTPLANNLKFDQTVETIVMSLIIPPLEEFTREPVTLGDHLRRLRIELGFYQKDVAVQILRNHFVSTMIPIFIPLMAKGMSIGAVVVLTIGGAGASLPEVIMLKRIFKWPMLVAFLAAVFFIAITAGMVFNTVLL